MGKQHDALFAAKLAGSSGGGGTSDYDDLTNKPQINGTTLTGDKSSADLGLLPASTKYGSSIEATPIATAQSQKMNLTLKDQDGNALDTTSFDLPIKDIRVNIENAGLSLIYQGGLSKLLYINALISGKVDKIQGKGLSTEDYTTAEKTKLAGLTNDYTNHTNKPQINGTILVGNKSLSDIGINYATATTAGIVKPDGVTTEVDENGVISVSTFAPTSWDGVQNIVRAGLASKFFKERDQLQCMKGNTVLTWDIIGIDQETPTDPLLTHSLTLQLHDCITDLQFDAKEALFAFENGLAAGAYHFTVTAQPWFAGDVNKTITFTLANAIPAGGQLVINNAYNATMIGSTISSYASGSAATAIETTAMSEGSSGTDLGSVAAALSQDGNTNSIHRALLGSNNWEQSAMRQYLNSAAAAGSAWVPKTKFDRPPAWVSSTAGFLNAVDPEFVSVLGKVNKTTALNTISDGGGKETKPEKVFLLSRSEVYAGDETTGGEGEPYSYYKNYSDLDAPGTGADSNRIKYRNGAAKYWWLRSPDASAAYTVHLIPPSGMLNSHIATYSSGVTPACVIV